jgi:hypothetical protein
MSVCERYAAGAASVKVLAIAIGVGVSVLLLGLLIAGFETLGLDHHR